MSVILPIIKEMTVYGFNLYGKNQKPGSEIVIDFDHRVSCVIGANGLGKSTLINCLVYGLTGFINKTHGTFKSGADFLENNKEARSYFDGRLLEEQKEDAYVSVKFLLDEKEIVVKRRFMPDNSVLECSINSDVCNDYEKIILDNTNLKQFWQFVFLVTKVITFDEDRECLFWNAAILTTALYITMGCDPEISEQADKLADESAKVSSRIRNTQFEIGKQNKRIQILEEELATNIKKQASHNAAEEVLEKCDSLMTEISEIENELERDQNEIDVHTPRIADLNYKKYAMKEEYNYVYDKFMRNNMQIHIKQSPLYLELVNGHCPMCSADNIGIKPIEHSIHEKMCPLCNSALNENSSAEIVEELSKIDAKLEEATRELHGVLSHVTSLNEGIRSKTQRKIELQNTLKALSEEHDIVIGGEQANELLVKRIEALKLARDEVENEKKEQQKESDALKLEANNYNRILHDSYRRAQAEFLPLFKKYAKSFTGTDVDLQLIPLTNDTKMQFVFQLNFADRQRKQESQLSESQRFFIDIALRFAIINYMSLSGNGKGIVIIDTPEGSLDIAYENNAGEMFSMYAEEGHQLIITANANSSRLVKKLASIMKRTNLGLINMMHWSNLTAVQLQNESLFAEVIYEIEKEMG